jgi:hypothetical protein
MVLFSPFRVFGPAWGPFMYRARRKSPGKINFSTGRELCALEDRFFRELKVVRKRTGCLNTLLFLVPFF